MIILTLMTTSLSLLAIICSLQLKISFLKADCPQRIASFPVFLIHFLNHVMHWELVYSTLDISEMRVSMYLILKVVPLIWEAYPCNGIAVAELVYFLLHSVGYLLCSLAIESIRPCNNCVFLKNNTWLSLKHWKLSSPKKPVIKKQWHSGSLYQILVSIVLK